MLLFFGFLNGCAMCYAFKERQVLPLYDEEGRHFQIHISDCIMPLLLMKKSSCLLGCMTIGPPSKNILHA